MLYSVLLPSDTNCSMVYFGWHALNEVKGVAVGPRTTPFPLVRVCHQLFRVKVNYYPNCRNLSLPFEPIKIPS